METIDFEWFLNHLPTIFFGHSVLFCAGREGVGQWCSGGLEATDGQQLWMRPRRRDRGKLYVIVTVVPAPKAN